jgi:hypothetical protein
VKEIMSTKLVEEENTVYEVDEECLKEKTVEMEGILQEVQDQECMDISEQECCEGSSQGFPIVLFLLLLCCCRH